MTPYRERREAGHYDAPETEEAAAEEAVADEAAPEAEDAAAAEAAAPDYAFMTKTELIMLAQQRGISPANAAMSKADLITALKED